MNDVDLFYVFSHLPNFFYFFLLHLAHLVLIPFVSNFGASTVELFQKTPDHNVHNFVVFIFVQVWFAFLTIQ